MKLHLLPFLLIVSLVAEGQRYKSTESKIDFFSKAALEDIAATNRKAVSLIDLATGQMAFTVPIQEFQFAKKLMQEHFNEKYMESDKFPQATFSARLSGFDPMRTDAQDVSASGTLTLHGVSREVTLTGTMEKRADRIYIKARFPVTLVDYNISRPQLLWQNIAEVIDVTVSFTYQPHEK